MKKYFEYIGLLAFALFSFYYTDKVTNMMNSKDPVMVSINEYKEKENTPCKEGYITNDGIVLGRSGREVNTIESYSNMQGKSFDESLLVFNEVTCKVSLETAISGYIINANPSKNLVSLFIKIDSLDYFNDIEKVLEEKNTLANIITNGKTLSENKEYFLSLYNKGYEIVYNGTGVDDYRLYKKELKEMNKNAKVVCMSISEGDISFCEKEKVLKLKTSYYYNKDILLNTKKNLEKGSFIIYKENKNTLEEISSAINYINGKKLAIKPISEALK